MNEPRLTNKVLLALADEVGALPEVFLRRPTRRYRNVSPPNRETAYKWIRRMIRYREWLKKDRK